MQVRTEPSLGKLQKEAVQAVHEAQKAERHSVLAAYTAGEALWKVKEASTRENSFAKWITSNGWSNDKAYRYIHVYIGCGRDPKNVANGTVEQLAERGRSILAERNRREGRAPKGRPPKPKDSGKKTTPATSRGTKPAPQKDSRKERRDYLDGVVDEFGERPVKAEVYASTAHLLALLSDQLDREPADLIADAVEALWIEVGQVPAEKSPDKDRTSTRRRERAPGAARA